MSNVNESINLDKYWELINFCEFDKYATKSYCAIHNVDESLNLGDITKVDETKLADFNMICGGSPCFVKGTKVYTGTGYKKIEDVKVGDLVLTHTGKFQKVVRVGNKFSDDIYELKAQGILNTTVTGNHPYYVRSSKRKWNNDRRSYDRIFTNPEWKRVKDIVDNEYIGLPVLSTSENIYNLSNDECWLLGRYVADGYICNSKRPNRNNSYNHKVTFCIGKDKLTEFKKATSNSKYYIGVTEDRTVYKCRIVNINFMNLCLQCGKGAENKNIPYWILNLPIEMLKTFLDGYMSGDGCYTNNNYKATTISKELAMGLCLCIAKVYGVGARIYKTKRRNKTVIEGRIVNQKDTYEVVFTKEKRKQTNYAAIDNIIWLPVRSIEKLDYSSQVYNLEVENDNSYTANNAIVHNCQDFSVAGKQKGSVWTCKDCGHEYNPLTVHWSKRDKCPQCNSNNIEKTRSSLLVEYLRVIRANKPNFGIYENVKNIVGKQFRDTTFKLFEDELHEYGYNTYWKVLNAKNYGIPQNRERVYLIFIRKDLDNSQFKFPEPFDNGIRLKDILEYKVDEKFYLSDDKVQKFLSNFNQSELPVTTRNSDTASTIRATYYKNGERNVCENIENGNGYEGIVESNDVKQMGNIVETGNWSNPQRGRIYSAEGCCPTLNTCGGGGLEPKIVTGLISNKGERFEKEIDTANTLLARDYKGFGNQAMNAVIKIPQATKQGYIECEVGGVADLSYPNSKTRRGRVQENGTISPTITATETGICRIEKADGCYTNQSPSFTRAPLKGLRRTLKADSHPAGVYDGIRIRKLTPRECFRLMGFSDQNFDAAAYTHQTININGDDLQRNVKLTDVIEKLSQKGTEISVSCITNVLQELEKISIEWMKYHEKQEKEKNKNVNIVIERLDELEHLECATNIIKCLESTEILCGLIKEIDQHQMVIIGLGKKGKQSIEKYMKITSEESLHPMKLYIILMVLELIIESKIYTSSVQKVSIQGAIVNLEECKKNMAMEQNLDLKVDIISTMVSASQLYKQAGNSIVVDVLYYIYVELYKAMPYLFDDLKLSSFFSGIGAFESGLDRLYEGINSGNFINPQVE